MNRTRRHIWFFSPKRGFAACLSCEVRKTAQNDHDLCPGSGRPEGPPLPSPVSPPAAADAPAAQLELL
jgi:hypothetical protein